MINSQDFAENLKNSSLSKADKEAILALLPKLNKKAINELNNIFKKDILNQQSLYDKAKLKLSIYFDKFKKDIEGID